jgi:adsorption protein B
LLLYGCAVTILFSGIDDFFIDLVFWFQKITGPGQSQKKEPSRQELDNKPEQPIAMMVPAWQEALVIAKMAQVAAETFLYDNYHIFIGTYPNDPETQKAVDGIALTYPNVHKVVTKNPGPSTKADCLNNVIGQILRFEQEEGIRFEIIYMHDAEDVVHPYELKVMNFYVPDYDLVQIPVVPLPRKWWQFTPGHYLDEFSEVHGKDMLVRERLIGNVPSAGVATAFSRHALNTLFRIHKGLAFNTESLTEDYDIAYRLKVQGLKEHFVRIKIPGGENPINPAWKKLSNLVASRGYFPTTFNRAKRQKSRWIIGIVFQGWQSIGWPKGLANKYVFYRDRKAVFTNPAIGLAYFVTGSILLMEIFSGLGDGTYWYPALIPPGSHLWTLLTLNGFFLLSRLFHRAFFVTEIYGIKEGLLSAPRMVWGNVINFFAFARAVNQFFRGQQQKKEVAWDKTDHEFPDEHLHGEPLRDQSTIKTDRLDP